MPWLWHRGLHSTPRMGASICCRCGRKKERKKKKKDPLPSSFRLLAEFIFYSCMTKDSSFLLAGCWRLTSGPCHVGFLNRAKHFINLSGRISHSSLSRQPLKIYVIYNIPSQGLSITVSKLNSFFFWHVFSHYFEKTIPSSFVYLGKLV